MNKAYCNDKEQSENYLKQLNEENIIEKKRKIMKFVEDRIHGSIEETIDEMVNILEESEERYRKLFELSPDAIVVHSDGEILMANLNFAKMLGYNASEDVIGKSMYDFLHPDSLLRAKSRMAEVKSENVILPLKEFKFISADGEIKEVEATANGFSLNGRKVIQAILRNVTDCKSTLKIAASIQKARLDRAFPLPLEGKLETLYRPSNIISGDFFHFYKENDSTVTGILGDVRGKGVPAALTCSALKVLFYENVVMAPEFCDVVKRVNGELGKYLEEEYVAASFFRFDFQRKNLQSSAQALMNLSFAERAKIALRK